MGRKRKHQVGKWPTRVYERSGTAYYATPAGKWVQLGPASEPQTVYAALGALLNTPVANTRTLTVSHLIDLYCSEELGELTPGTRQTYEGHLKFLRHGLGGVPAAQLLPLHVKQYMLARGSAKRANDEKATLGRVLASALGSGLIDRNAARELDYKRKVTPKKGAGRAHVTDAQLRQLLDHSPEWLKVAILFMVTTGARKGDVGTWTWDRVEIRDGLFIYTPNKTARFQKVQKLRMTPQLDQLVTRARNLHDGNLFIVNGTGGPIVKTGEKPNTRCIDEAWKRAMIKAGMGPTTEQWFTPHDCKGKALTDIFLRTGSKEAAQALGAHSEQRTTLRYLTDAATIEANEVDASLLS